MKVTSVETLKSRKDEIFETRFMTRECGNEHEHGLSTTNYEEL